MKSIKASFVLSVLLFTSSSFADVIQEEKGSEGIGAVSSDLGSYSCNIVGEKSTAEIQLLRSFYRLSNQNDAQMVYELLIYKNKKYPSEGLDIKLQYNLVAETLAHAKRTRMATNQEGAYVNEFMNPGSSENCLRLTGFMTRIKYYSSLLRL